MKRLILLTLLTLVACAPTATQSTLPYQVDGNRMDNNFAPAPCPTCTLEINFLKGIIPGFTLVYTGPNWRFLEGPGALIVDGVRYGATGTRSSRTVVSGGVMEVASYILPNDVTDALLKAQKVVVEAYGTVNLRVELSPENLNRMKLFYTDAP